MEASQLPVPFWRGRLPWVILAETGVCLWGLPLTGAWLMPRVDRPFSAQGILALDGILLALGLVAVILSRDAWPDAWIMRRWTAFMLFLIALTIGHIGFAGNLVPRIEGWPWPEWALGLDIPGFILTLIYLWGWGMGIGFLSLVFGGRSLKELL